MTWNAIDLFVISFVQEELSKRYRRLRIALPLLALAFVVLTVIFIWNLVSGLRANSGSLLSIILPLMLATVAGGLFFYGQGDIRQLRTDPAGYAAKSKIKGVYSAQNVAPLSLPRSASNALDDLSEFPQLRGAMQRLYELREKCMATLDTRLINALTDTYLVIYNETLECLQGIDKTARAVAIANSYVESEHLPRGEMELLLTKWSDRFDKYCLMLPALTQRIVRITDNYTPRVSQANTDRTPEQQEESMRRAAKAANAALTTLRRMG